MRIVRFETAGHAWHTGEGEGKVSPRKSVVQSAYQYDVTSRVSDYQNGEQRVHRRDGKKFPFYHGNTVPISWIWRFEDPYSHRKQHFGTFWE